MFLCFQSCVCSSLNVALTPFVLFLRSQLLSGHLSPRLQVLCRPRPRARFLDPLCVLFISHTSSSPPVPLLSSPSLPSHPTQRVTSAAFIEAIRSFSATLPSQHALTFDPTCCVTMAGEGHLPPSLLCCVWILRVRDLLLTIATFTRLLKIP